MRGLRGSRRWGGNKRKVCWKQRVAHPSGTRETGKKARRQDQRGGGRKGRGLYCAGGKPAALPPIPGSPSRGGTGMCTQWAACPLGRLGQGEQQMSVRQRHTALGAGKREHNTGGRGLGKDQLQLLKGLGCSNLLVGCGLCGGGMCTASLAASLAYLEENDRSKRKCWVGQQGTRRRKARCVAGQDMREAQGRAGLHPAAAARSRRAGGQPHNAALDGGVCKD